MKIGSQLLLASSALIVCAAVAHYQLLPGYLDSDYYFAGGIQLAQGKGFTEPYIWNYLDDPGGLPHPSHTYWMPLASIIAAGGLWSAGANTYSAGRLGFFALAALVPVVTAAVAFSFSRRRDLAMASGLLGVFTVYYEPFLTVPDNYAAYLVLGGLFFLAMQWKRDLAYLFMGVVAGLLTLSRSDGILWLGLVIALIIVRCRWRANGQDAQNGTRQPGTGPHAAGLRASALRGLMAVAGFLAVAGPWFWRTYRIFGTALAPGGAHLLWLTTYDETFLYPASKLTLSYWLAQGWPAILSTRLVALKWNLLNAVAAQGAIFLAPFILIGLWGHRRDQRMQLGVLGWCMLLFVMTVIFPFAGERGGFFHAGAAFQSLWWAMAPLGLEATVARARSRNLFTPQAFMIFRAGLVAIAALMTAAIIAIRVLPGWALSEKDYSRVEALLVRSGIQPQDRVMVRNPPGYFLVTGRPAVVVPYGDASSILAVAIRYDIKYVVLESEGASGPIRSVYDNTNDPRFQFLGQLEATRIFQVRP